ncbi:hypothetical protein Dda_1551 [Drechslerella dactyloides]|uniref:Uncharacterized protein n=1 Tax=Drechslerella dactyloides TaxID=74499 RepID=A0AAD6J1X6_DREDA|nr:hypothetical protein Dda_1551 [Drechslerella dactyloides]
MPSSMTLRSRRRAISSSVSAESSSRAASPRPGARTTPIDLTDPVEMDFEEILRTPSPLSGSNDDDDFDESFEWTARPSLQQYVTRLKFQREQPDTLKTERWKSTRQLTDYLGLEPEEHNTFTNVIYRLIDGDEFIRRFDGKTTPGYKKDRVCGTLTRHMFDSLDGKIIRKIAALPHKDEEIGYALWKYFLDRRNGGRSRETYQERKTLQEDEAAESGLLREIHGKKRRGRQGVQSCNSSPGTFGISTPLKSTIADKDVEDYIARGISPIRREIQPMQRDIADIQTTQTEILDILQTPVSSRISPFLRFGETPATSSGRCQQYQLDQAPSPFGPRNQNVESSQFVTALRQIIVDGDKAVGLETRREMDKIRAKIDILSRNQAQGQRDNQKHRQVVIGLTIIILPVLVLILFQLCTISSVLVGKGTESHFDTVPFL